MTQIQTAAPEAKVTGMRQYDATPLLQVMICTYGTDGIARTASSCHPAVSGVEYLVSWQTDGSTPLPASLKRSDMKIFPVATRGLSANRNHALAKASAPLLLISDDDVDYTEGYLRSVIAAFGENPDADILTFMYETKCPHKTYPDRSVSLADPPKGYFISSIEIAFRREPVQGKIWFNENFGIGAVFPSGEEDIFIHDCLAAGLTGRFIPLTSARHDGDTTGQRTAMLPSLPQTKGAVFLAIHPADWLPRMIVHALRESRRWIRGKGMFPLAYMHHWLAGAAKARHLRVFPTPDYSKKYLADG